MSYSVSVNDNGNDIKMIEEMYKILIQLTLANAVDPSKISTLGIDIHRVNELVTRLYDFKELIYNQGNLEDIILEPILTD